MIEASFDGSMDRNAAVSGAFQYDTGQRLRMHGLPSPTELALEDELLSGNLATMQVHFGLKGDSQTQARLALWDEGSGCWMAMIPDEYLQQAESVYAYIYVSHGQDENGNRRTKTMYALTFRPIARPAPDNVATSEQWEAWASKREEMDLTMEALEAAEGKARAAQQQANMAGQEALEAQTQAQDAKRTADEAMRRLDAVETLWNGMRVNTVSLAAGAQATAAIEAGVLTLGLPRGKRGEKGQTGDNGPADIALSMTEGILTITPRE